MTLPKNNHYYLGPRYLDKVRAGVREGAGGAPEFGVSEKWTEREMDSLLLSAPPDLKT